MNRLLSQLARPLALVITCTLLPAAATTASAASTRALSFGGNGSGQTGLGTTTGNTLVATPIVRSYLGELAVTQVAAGGTHSLLLAEDGSVFSFGSNSDGETGLGTISHNTLVATPIDASNLGGPGAKQVAAGYHHSLLIGVPEPGALALAGAAALALVGCVRRSRS
jgi:hypothetical protein